MVYETRSPDALCCCEYIDLNQSRAHIFGCCCNCPELDNCFERLITCKRVPRQVVLRIMSSVQDRIRLPWRGGAKQVALHSILPVVLIPLLGYIAAHGVWISVVIFTTLPTFLIYTHYIFMKDYLQTRFFYVWLLTSITTIYCVFEAFSSRMLEIRNDENFVFTLFTALVFLSMYKVKLNSELSHVSTEDGELVNDEDGKGKVNTNMCVFCKKLAASRTYHCRVCQVCVIQRDQHSAWLDCCIGESNHHWYMLFLIFTISQLTLGSNLILTTICHPFKFYMSIMLPDDCSDVYFDVLYGVCFVTAIYCLLCLLFLLTLLVHELWLISIGLTGHEWRNISSDRLSCCGLCTHHPYNSGLLRNWIVYFKGPKNHHSLQTI